MPRWHWQALRCGALLFGKGKNYVKATTFDTSRKKLKAVSVSVFVTPIHSKNILQWGLEYLTLENRIHSKIERQSLVFEWLKVRFLNGQNGPDHSKTELQNGCSNLGFFI